MALISLNSVNVPGVYVFESPAGNTPEGVSSHNAVYMVGYSSKAGIALNTPTFVESITDFTNTFGTSFSAASVNLFFDQLPGNGLNFVAVAPKVSRTITVPTATVGQTYTLTVDGYAISYLAVTGDNAAAIVSKLTDLVNTTALHLGVVTNGVLRTLPATTVTASANITLGAASTVASYPTVADVADALRQAFDDDTLPQGFIIAPEFFQQWTNPADAAALANAMEAIASDPTRFWIALSDCLQATATQTTGAGAINLAIAERQALTSPRGHLAYYFPYLKNLSGTLVPSSAAVAGVALRRFRQQGFRQPIAGNDYPIYAVTDVSYKVTNKMQERLNPLGINCIRKDRNKGIRIFGARTISTNANYTFLTTRQIFNVLAISLNRSMQDRVFTSVDGAGVAMGDIKGTATGLCERLRQAGALFGETPEKAYRVVCGMENNTTSDLDGGKLYVDVYAKPSPTLEVAVIRLYRSPLGMELSEETLYTSSPLGTVTQGQTAGTGVGQSGNGGQQ